jgi:TRAP transporter 4TM/12TM fusion protein
VRPLRQPGRGPRVGGLPITAIEPDEEAGSGPTRRLSGLWLQAATGFGVALALFHLYAALVPTFAELTRNTIHFGGFALLCALWYPDGGGHPARTGTLARPRAFGAAVAAAAVYLGQAESAIYDRGVRLSPLDWTAGAVVILGALEFTRRTAGFIIPILIVLALGYVVWWGKFVGGVFNFPGLSAETVLFRALYGDDAMFGTIARISSTTVFLFIIFGAFLLRSGAGDFVIELSRAVAGRLAGGPGLVAVIASGLTGTISGSAVANTASTGVITIPLMKRAGFKATFAGGVEAAASTGGQIMPPIMGAGAFVMASYTQIPYETIVAVAALPAILYFATVAFFVRIEARRLGLVPEDEAGPRCAGAGGARRQLHPAHRRGGGDADRGLHAELRGRVRHRRGDRVELADRLAHGAGRGVGGAGARVAEHDHDRRAAVLGRASWSTSSPPPASATPSR